MPVMPFSKERRKQSNWDFTNDFLNPFMESKLRGTQEDYQTQSFQPLLSVDVNQYNKHTADETS